MCVINGLPECAGHFVELYENPSYYRHGVQPKLLTDLVC
ncbi:hypothetical protein SRABI106_04296 [Rahnella aquatilis]|nr:hypothetical protein SRABI106_04296 [Rahnella aquatilis]